MVVKGKENHFFTFVKSPFWVQLKWIYELRWSTGMALGRHTVFPVRDPEGTDSLALYLAVF